MSNIFLNFFSENDTYKTICASYWEVGDDNNFVQTVSDIAKSFSISSNEISKICKNNCAAESTILDCNICETPYTYKTRTDFLNVNHDQIWECESCKYDKKTNEDSNKILAVKESLEYRKEHPFSLEQLDFREAIFLLSLIKYLASEDLKFLTPYNSNNISLLTPMQEYDFEIF